MWWLMLNKLQYLSWTLSLFSVCFAISAKAESQEANLKSQENSVSKIFHLNEFPQTPTTVKEWLSQSPTSSPNLVTGVRIQQTQGGIEVILDTKEAEKLQPTSRNEGNSVIIDIPNAQLRLGNENIFRQEKAIAGISLVEVTNTQSNGIRLTVTGETALPKVELFDSNEELIFGVTPVTTATQPSTPTEPEKPTSETQPEQPSADNQEPIELVVTGEQDGYRVPDATAGTRTDTPLRDIPFSVKVVPRQVLEDQKVQRVTDALRNVAGVGADQSSRSAFDVYTIRGIPGRYFNNNIIINGLRDGYTFTAVDVANVEQIEVLKGPGAALFGQGQLGGTINVTTKQPLSTPAYSV